MAEGFGNSSIYTVSTNCWSFFYRYPVGRQVCRLVRTVTRQEKTTREVAYAITSVSREQADASQLLEWWRGHWGIENEVHWIRDETFGEDRSRARTGHAPQNLAALRNAAINCLRSDKVTHIAATLRENAWNSQALLTRLGKPNF